MTFRWPYALVALPFVLAALLVLFKGSRRARERLLGQFASNRLLPLLLVSYSPALRRIKHALIATGALLVVLAMARPQWGYDWQEQRTHGVDVVFVIDTSRSMLTQDVQPSRLERAKLAIYDCVEKMGGNRVGLVAFAGDAFLQCPLTLDYDAFRQTLDIIDTNTIAEGGTDIGIGLDVAAKALEDSGNHKIIVLLTDGEDLEGQGISEAQELAKQGVTIYTVGVGTAAGDVIPIKNASGQADFVRDERGEIVHSHLDAATLTSIASATGGFYAPLGATGEGLAKVYEDGIKKMPEQNLTSQMRRLPIERFQWPLAAGFVLLALEMLIGTRRPNWRRSKLTTVNLAEPIPVSAATVPASGPKAKSPPPAKASVLAGLLLLATIVICLPRAVAQDAPVTTDNPPSAPAAAAASASSPATTAPKTPYSAKDAETLFDKGNFPSAADAYNQAAADAPQDSRFRYDQGESLYRDGDFAGAADAFTKTLSSNDLTLQQRAYYNLGNADYRIGQSQMKDDPQKTVATWESAIKDYQNALDLNSADPDARYNLNFAKVQLEALKKKLEQQQQQQQQNQPQQNQNQDQQNQQNQNQQNQSQQNQSQNQQNNQDQQNQNQPNQSQNQNSQNQNNSSQNQPNQQNQNSQNQHSPNQSQQNQNQSQPNQNSQNSSGNQNQPNQNPSGQPNQNNPSNQPNQQNGENPRNQNQPNPQNGGTQPKPQNGTGNQNQASPNQPGQPKPQSGNQNQPQPSPGQSTDQKPGNQGQNQTQAQPPNDTSGKEPGQQNQGQNKAQAQAAAGSAAPGASGQQGDAAAGGTRIAGVMTRDEAQQLLDSLKTYERKMPAAPSQGTAEKNNNPDQFHKDW